MEHPDNRLVASAVRAARAVGRISKNAPANISKLHLELAGLASDPSRPSELRLQTMAAMDGKTACTNAAQLDLMVSSLSASQPPTIRTLALEVLQRASFEPDGLRRLIEAIPALGPMELSRLLPVFEQQPDEKIGRELLAALRQTKAGKSLPAATVRGLFAHYPATVQNEAAAFIGELNTDSSRQAAHLDALATELKSLPGDIRRGQVVFNSPKALCITCHKVGYLGGNTGPDLTSIGQSRTERDLLESIVYPSASFVRSYEPLIVSMKTGESYNGVVRRDTAEELLLATGPNAEVRVARADVAEIRPGTVSIMPQGLDEQLTRQELSDLLAFLKNTRWGAQ
jgi:putative heme-binding domain-containing protein